MEHTVHCGINISFNNYDDASLIEMNSTYMLPHVKIYRGILQSVFFFVWSKRTYFLHKFEYSRDMESTLDTIS